MSRFIAAFKRFTRGKVVVLVIILAAILIGFRLYDKYFWSLDNIKTVLYMSALSGILMIGFGTLLISGNADMSFAAVGTICAVIGCLLINAGVPWPIAFIGAIIAGGACGAFNALLWYKFRITPFIGTMGMANVWSGLAAYITKNNLVHTSDKGFAAIGSTVLFNFLPISFLYVILLCLIYGFILTRTKFGRKVYMCGGNMFAARLSGVNIAKVGTIMMINTSCISAFGGMVTASRMNAIGVDSLSNSMMSSITGSMLGGISFGGGAGGLGGAFLGLLVLNFFNNGLIKIGMSPYWQVFAQGALLIVALVIDYVNNRSRNKMLKTAG
jgi:ribose/xylose/arabinose/galactoside ABC-type transport system permease subunit